MWRTIGAGFGVGDLGLGATGAGRGDGAAAAVTVGVGACTMRLLTTVLMPATWAASAAAKERAASVLTVPVRVATCFWTEDWMGSLLMAPSLAMRLWRAAVRLASSVGAGGGELLQPARVRTSARMQAAMVERAIANCFLAYIRPLCCDKNFTANNVNQPPGYRITDSGLRTRSIRKLVFWTLWGDGGDAGSIWSLVAVRVVEKRWDGNLM
jgi:hypothetical protein